MPNQWLLLLLSVVHLVPAGAATAPGLTPQPPGVVSARGETGRTYEAGDIYEARTCIWSTSRLLLSAGWLSLHFSSANDRAVLDGA